jgi:sulfur relay (sulfurtransferase) DsrC/TusE family protein
MIKFRLIQKEMWTCNGNIYHHEDKRDNAIKIFLKKAERWWKLYCTLRERENMRWQQQQWRVNAAWRNFFTQFPFECSTRSEQKHRKQRMSMSKKHFLSAAFRTISVILEVEYVKRASLTEPPRLFSLESVSACVFWIFPQQQLQGKILILRVQASFCQFCANKIARRKNLMENYCRTLNF